MENRRVENRDTAELIKKPQVKKKLVVRQTLTSYKRMLKANPLLQLEEAGIKIDEILKYKSTNVHSTTEHVNSILKDSVKKEKKNISGFKKSEIKEATKSQNVKKSLNDVPKINIISGNKATLTNKRSLSNKNNESITSRYSQKKLQQTNINKSVVTSKVNSFRITPNLSHTKGIKSQQKPTGKTSLRRSLSSDDIRKDKHDAKLHMKPNRTCSQDNLLSAQKTSKKCFSPIVEENSAHKSFIFKTPSAHERRSIYQYTPKSTPRPTSLFQSSTPFLTDKNVLQERLNQWLKSRGKKLSSFHHLSCFGIGHKKKVSQPLIKSEENKENVETLKEKCSSYENLKINMPQVVCNSEPEKDISNENLNKVAKEALIELQNLVCEDYPHIQCMGWLELIRDRYRKIEEEPEYWECRAIIEQSAGNVGNAVEYYKTAIIQGAEVHTVEKSLDELLKKFSLLNISPHKSEMNKIDKTKEKIIKEARNVFKSSIIKFAIQEKKLKKNQTEIPNTPKLIITPVRRSTRLSRSGYISTPGIKLCTSLKEVDNTDISFEKNKALC